jgi:hypothetical protein
MTQQQIFARQLTLDPEKAINIRKALNTESDRQMGHAKRLMMTALNQPNFEMRKRYIGTMVSRMQGEGNEKWAKSFNDLLQLPEDQMTQQLETVLMSTLEPEELEKFAQGKYRTVREMSLTDQSSISKEITNYGFSLHLVQTIRNGNGSRPACLYFHLCQSIRSEISC